MSTDLMVGMPPLPSTIRNVLNDDLLHIMRKFSHVPFPENCITCEGRGEFDWWAWTPEGERQVATWQCDCRGQFKLLTNFYVANLKLNYQRYGWGDVEAVEPGAIEKAKAYLDKAGAYVNRGFGLTLYGNMGTGKTMLAILVLKHLIGLGYQGYFTTFGELLDSKQTSWKDIEERDRYLSRIRGARVLVLDDLGKEHFQRRLVGAAEADQVGTNPGPQRYSTAVAESALDDLLRHRVASASPTIVTSNLSLTEIGNNYGKSIVSLLSESSSTYEFVAEDWRPNARIRMDDEIEAGLTRPIVLG